MQTKTILEVRQLKYTYGSGTNALNGVDLIIREGEKIAVIGSNGSGKSTFFLNLNGVYFPDAGTIHYRGTELNKNSLKDLRKHIGIVFQDADNQIIAATVRSEVGFGPLNLKLSKSEVVQRVDAALETLSLTALSDRPPHYLSGGEKKRVTIAGILSMHPEIIIFDEPTASLDPMGSKMLENLLGDLTAAGKTLILSTHDIEFAYRWADRIIVFDKGKIIGDGTVLEIFRDDRLLQRANLIKPSLLDVYEAMVAAKLLPDTKAYPKTSEALKSLINLTQKKNREETL